MLKTMLKYTFAGAVLFPFALLLALSFGQNWRFPALLPAVWTMDNWQLLLTSQSDLAQSLLRSLSISAGIATAATGLGFITAKHIAYHPWRQQWLTLAYLPYIFAPVILAATLQFFFLRLGLAGNVPGVLFAQLLIAYPFGVIFFYGFLERPDAGHGAAIGHAGRKQAADLPSGVVTGSPGGAVGVLFPGLPHLLV